jgi:hypothetical protein
MSRPTKEEIEQIRRDAIRRALEEKAYMDAMRNTPPAPMQAPPPTPPLPAINIPPPPPQANQPIAKKTGGKIKGYKAGGYVRAADGIAQRGKTKGKIV